jgi:hypothetical protein
MHTHGLSKHWKFAEFDGFEFAGIWSNSRVRTGAVRSTLSIPAKSKSDKILSKSMMNSGGFWPRSAEASGCNKCVVAFALSSMSSRETLVGTAMAIDLTYDAKDWKII